MIYRLVPPLIASSGRYGFRLLDIWLPSGSHIPPPILLPGLFRMPSLSLPIALPASSAAQSHDHRLICETLEVFSDVHLFPSHSGLMSFPSQDQRYALPFTSLCVLTMCAAMPIPQQPCIVPAQPQLLSTPSVRNSPYFVTSALINHSYTRLRPQQLVIPPRYMTLPACDQALPRLRCAPSSLSHALMPSPLLHGARRSLTSPLSFPHAMQLHPLKALHTHLG